ncbi:MAG: hypothetical protein ABFD69_14610 [Candidatus Sumerlaeia bacterium]
MKKYFLPTATILVVAVYLALRVPGLAQAPIFVDEANYSVWVAQMLGSPCLQTALIPWTDDKVGILPWIIAVLDAAGWPGQWGPMLLWRYVSIALGLVTVALLMTMARRLAGPDPSRRGLAMIAAGLGWAVWSAAVIHERMAIFDGALTAAWLFAIYVMETLPRDRIPTRRAAYAGFAVALPAIVKLSGLPALGIGGLTMLWHWRRGRLSGRGLLAYAAVNAAIAVPPVALCLGYGTLAMACRLHMQAGGPGYLENFSSLVRQFGSMMLLSSFPIALAFMLIGAIEALRPGRSEESAGPSWLLLWVCLPIAMIFAIGKYPGVFTRYYLPFAAPLWIAFGLGVATLSAVVARKTRTPAALCGAVFLCGSLAFPAWQSVLWQTDPGRELFTDRDRAQYVTGWPSGRQVGSLRAKIEPLTARGPVELITFNNYTNPASAIRYIERRRPDRFRAIQVRSQAEAVRLLAQPPPSGTRLLLDGGGPGEFDPKLLPASARLFWEFRQTDPWIHTQRVWWVPDSGYTSPAANR